MQAPLRAGIYISVFLDRLLGVNEQVENHPCCSTFLARSPLLSQFPCPICTAFKGVSTKNRQQFVRCGINRQRLQSRSDLLCVQDYRFDAVLYTYVTWVDQLGVETWFQNNIATNCADPSRSD